MFRIIAVGVFFLPLAIAQEHDMSHMQMAGGDSNPAASDLMNMASGTSENPQSGSLPMLMRRHGGWNFMLMGQGYLVETQQTGPRGHDKLYSPNWGMFDAAHKLWGGTFQFDLMLSLEPATITKRRYPELSRQWTLLRDTGLPTVRTDCEALIADTEAILAELLESKKQGTDRLTERREATRRQLESVSQGVHVNQVYAETTPTLNHRFLNTDG